MRWASALKNDVLLPRLLTVREYKADTMWGPVNVNGSWLAVSAFNRLSNHRSKSSQPCSALLLSFVTEETTVVGKRQLWLRWKILWKQLLLNFIQYFIQTTFHHKPKYCMMFWECDDNCESRLSGHSTHLTQCVFAPTEKQTLRCKIDHPLNTSFNHVSSSVVTVFLMWCKYSYQL